MFKHEHAHVLEDPEREKLLPVASVLELLALRPGMRVADIGAGTGYFAIPMARAGARVVAVDMQPEMLERLRARLDPADSVTLVTGEATKTTLANASVDLAFLANVWHEIDDRPAAIAEIERVVVPHGRIAIVDWRPTVEESPGPPPDHRVAADDVVALLRDSGWQVESPHSVGPYHYAVLASKPH
jgi:ubiquinone/menaquinone biosynthesis C-methylase UbiE